MAMEIPVYLFTGFLEAGKTRFIQETLEDARFNAGERTLLLLCEEGEEEYAPDTFAGGNVFIETIEAESGLAATRLAALQKNTGPRAFLWNITACGCWIRSISTCRKNGVFIRSFCLWMPVPFWHTTQTCVPSW